MYSKPIKLNAQKYDCLFIIYEKKKQQHECKLKM